MYKELLISLIESLENESFIEYLYYLIVQLIA